MEEMLMEIINDGEKIVLLDGTTWMINPGDLPTVCTWLPTSSIKIHKLNTNDMFSYKLTNLSIDVSAYAMKLE
ncbi:MAG: hypothetical protein JEY96_19375 [Bacteroidales bacterium]|nr:hypothetical protein [Bacteroidales bacterium]